MDFSTWPHWIWTWSKSMTAFSPNQPIILVSTSKYGDTVYKWCKKLFFLHKLHEINRVIETRSAILNVWKLNAFFLFVFQFSDYIFSFEPNLLFICFRYSNWCQNAHSLDQNTILMAMHASSIVHTSAGAINTIAFTMNIYWPIYDTVNTGLKIFAHSRH